jgi:hypothetical protein
MAHPFATTLVWTEKLKMEIFHPRFKSDIIELHRNNWVIDLLSNTQDSKT